MFAGRSLMMMAPPSFCKPVDAPTKKFAVLVTGHASDYTLKNYGGYGPMLVNLLRDPGESWDVFHVVDGVFPDETEMGEYHGVVISGSRHDAHGNEPWINRLCELLKNLHQERKRILGICFGHQVVARALGGVTGRASAGWEIGLREVQLNKELSLKPYSSKFSGKLKLYESHRDQVLKLPPGGVILGSSKRTEVEMFGVGDHILGIQGHPEFTKDVLLDIIDSRVEAEVLTSDEAMEAKLSVQGEEDDKEEAQRICKSFLKC